MGVMCGLTFKGTGAAALSRSVLWTVLLGQAKAFSKTGSFLDVITK
jgi:hypothetical protein